MAETIGKYNVLLDVKTQLNKQAKDKVIQEAKGIEGQFQGIKRAAGGILAGAAIAQGLRVMGQYVSASVDMAAQFEQTTVSFKTLVGSMGTAKKLLNDIAKFSEKTPFTPEELEQSAKLLLSFGTNANEVVDVLKNIGAVSSAIGQPLQRVGLIFGQVQAKGKLMGEELLQFREAGIPVIELLATSMEKSRDEINKLQAEGKITFRDLKKAFADAAKEGGKFAGSLEDQSKTLTGLRSTLQGLQGILLRVIGERFLGTIKKATEGMIGLVESMIKFVEVPAEEKIERERRELNDLIGAITGTNVEQEERNRLIGELQEQYPDFLENLDAEKVTNEELVEKLEAVNEQYLIRARLARNQRFIDENNEKILENEDEILKILKQQARLKDTGAALESSPTFGAGSKGASDQLDARLKLLRDENNRLELANTELLKVNATLAPEDEEETKPGDPAGSGDKDKKTAFEKLKKRISEFQKKLQDQIFTGDFAGAQATARELKILEEQVEKVNKEYEKLTGAQIFGSIVDELEKTISETEKLRENQVALGDTVGASESTNKLKKYKEQLESINTAIQAYDEPRTVAGLENLESLGKINPVLDKFTRIQEIYAQILVFEERLKDAQGAETIRNLRAEIKKLQDELALLVGKIKDAIKPSEDKKPSFLQKLFGLDDEQFKEFEKQLSIAGETAKRFIEDTLDFQINKVDREIELQEKRVDKARQLAEDGNAAQLEAEEEKLDELTRQREAFVLRQQALSQLEIISSQGVAAAESIKAVAQAFSSPGGLAKGIATSLALAAQVAAIGLAVKNAFSELPAFAEGEERIWGPGSETSDSIIARLSRNERVVDAKTNRAIGYDFKNEDLPAAANMYRSMGQIDPKIIVGMGKTGNPDDGIKEEIISLKNTMRGLEEDRMIMERRLVNEMSTINKNLDEFLSKDIDKQGRLRS